MDKKIKYLFQNGHKKRLNELLDVTLYGDGSKN